jgi:hypothetical protein
MRSAARLSACTLISVLGLVAVNAAQLSESLIATVKHARSRGQGLENITLEQSSSFDGLAPLAERLHQRTITAVTPVRLGVAQSILPSSIYTWHILRVDRRLSGRIDVAPVGCDGAPPSIPDLQENEIAVQFYGGSTVVDGFTLTFKDTQTPKPSLGQRYLAFLTHCSRSAAGLRDGPFGWFELDPNGAISSPYGMTNPEIAAVVAFGTIQRLQASLSVDAK